MPLPPPAAPTHPPPLSLSGRVCAFVGVPLSACKPPRSPWSAHVVSDSLTGCDGRVRFGTDVNQKQELNFSDDHPQGPGGADMDAVGSGSVSSQGMAMVGVNRKMAANADVYTVHIGHEQSHVREKVGGAPGGGRNAFKDVFVVRRPRQPAADQ